MRCACRGRGKKAIIGANAEIQTPDATTLDRVHAAILLQQSGQATALRTLLKAEQDSGPEFLRLANALSALYPGLSGFPNAILGPFGVFRE